MKQTNRKTSKRVTVPGVCIWPQPKPSPRKRYRISYGHGVNRKTITASTDLGITMEMAQRIVREHDLSPLVPMSEVMSLPLQTYFIQREDGGPIKIGKSQNIKNRLGGMQSGSPVTLVCIGYVEGDRELEFHERFHSLCICGEWFRPEQELLDFIATGAIACRISCPPLTPDQKKLQREGGLRRNRSREGT